MLKQEIWKDVPGYEGFYKISNHGRVLSQKRSGTPGGILKHNERHGYDSVALKKNGGTKRVSVHRLVAFSFCEIKQGKDQVNHKDSNKKNNYFENLEWVTAKENSVHAVLNGTKKGVRGSRNHNSKLTESDIPLIIKLRNEYGIKVKTIACIFGVQIQAIYQILWGESWSHIKLEVIDGKSNQL